LSSALLTQWRSGILEKLIVAQQVDKFTAFHGTVRYITMLTRVFRCTLATFYPVTLKYLYYACHYCILCDPFDSRLGTELLARCVGDCIVPFPILNLTSGPSANMSPKYGQNRLSCGLTDIGIFLRTVTGYVALMLRTEV